jgi:uncharacterized membrane protein HdeD (DUF308 family)
VPARPSEGSADRYWIVSLVRAVVVLVPAAIITFSNHYQSLVGSKHPQPQSPAFIEHLTMLGLLSFGGFAVLTGLLVAFGGFLIGQRTVRTVFIVQGAISVIAGVVALVFSTSGLGVLLYTVSVWALLTGAAELYSGIRTRQRIPAGRDWRLVGVLTLVLAIVFLLIPADVVLAIGLFGAYAAIVGVYLAIGGFSLRWGTGRPDGAGPTERTEPTESQA